MFVSATRQITALEYLVMVFDGKILSPLPNDIWRLAHLFSLETYTHEQLCIMQENINRGKEELKGAGKCAKSSCLVKLIGKR